MVSRGPEEKEKEKLYDHYVYGEASPRKSPQIYGPTYGLLRNDHQERIEIKRTRRKYE